MSFLDRIAECNNHDPSAYRPFYVAGQRVGAVRHALAERLREFLDVTDERVSLPETFATPGARSAALDRIVRHLEADGIVRGRRNEAYPVLTAWGTPPLLEIERAAAPYFGIRSYGVHMTGYVKKPDGIHIWVARRSSTKSTYPGMLDNTVAGGQPVGLGLYENLVKECWEEAGIPASLAQQALCVGAITYTMDSSDGLKPDVQFCYDLEMPADFEPSNTDGETEAFYLWPWAKVAKIVGETTEFKYNCNLVLIDFFVRHGLADPADPDYLAIVKGLRG
jgi:8-oxo-dGTP pyrophosphatase MutT (NUDIX family)